MRAYAHTYIYIYACTHAVHASGHAHTRPNTGSRTAECRPTSPPLALTSSLFLFSSSIAIYRSLPASRTNRERDAYSSVPDAPMQIRRVSDRDRLRRRPITTIDSEVVYGTTDATGDPSRKQKASYVKRNIFRVAKYFGWEFVSILGNVFY